MTWRTDSFFITSVSTRLKPRSSGWQRMSVSRRGFIRSQRGVIFNPPWRQTCHQLSTDSGKGKWFGQINHLTHWWLVSAPACLKGTADRRATTGWLKACVVLLTFHLRDDCRWVTNTSLLRFKARILTFRFARRSQEQMSQLAKRLDSNSRYGGARAAERHVLLALTVTTLTTTTFFFHLPAGLHPFLLCNYHQSTSACAFTLTRLSFGPCDSGSNGARGVWGACPLYPELRHEWTRVPLTAGLRNPSTSSAVDALMSSLLAAM